MVSRRTLLAAPLLALPARAQAAWPDRPVRLVVPFAPGGPADLIARTIAERLGTMWPQPVLVENRPGAGGNVGSEYVARTPPDGHVLLIAANTLVTSPALNPRLTFDPMRDFTPLAEAAVHPHILVVHPSVPARTLAEFLALARRQPVAYGSGGVGATSHLAGQLLASRAGVELIHVPYNGTAPAHTAVLGGQVQAVFQNPSLALPALRDNRLFALATTGPTRWRDLPDVPTVAESGFPGFDAPTWYGIFGPAGLPPAVTAKAEQGILAALASREAQTRLVGGGFDLPLLGAAAFRAVMQRDLELWGGLIRAAGIKAE